MRFPNQVPIVCFAVAVAARAVVAVLTAVPGRDASHYLWMAEELAAGRGESLFAGVFHPGYPLLVGGVLAMFPGMDGVAAGQWVSCGLGALAVFPLHGVTRRLFGAPAAFWACLLYAVGAWFCRHPADCLSEGPFYLLVALWAWFSVRAGDGGSGSIPAGVVAACAFLCRPEGAALWLVGSVWLWRRRGWGPALTFSASFAVLAAALPVGFALFGDGFTLTPKAMFVYGVGVGGSGAGGGLGYYTAQLARLPGAAFEDLGFVVFPLILWGVVLRRELLLLLPFALQCAIVPLLFSHYRFLSGFGVLMLAFAGLAAVDLARRLRPQGRLLPWLLVALVVGSEVGRLPRSRRVDRVVERELGRYLGDLLRPGETVAADMPRLHYYAGRKPPPPRPILPEEILEACRSDRVRFVAWVRPRTPLPIEELIRSGFEPMELPSILASLAEGRDALVYLRKRQ